MLFRSGLVGAEKVFLNICFISFSRNPLGGKVKGNSSVAVPASASQLSSKNNRILSKTFLLSSSKACFVRPTDAPMQITLSFWINRPVGSPMAAFVSQQYRFSSDSSHAANASVSDAVPMDVFIKIFLFPNYWNCSSWSKITFLFMQVITTCLSARI